MERTPFHYSDAQWGELAKIVEAAGGMAAKERFEAKRLFFEKAITGWKGSFDKKQNRARERHLNSMPRRRFTTVYLRREIRV